MTTEPNWRGAQIDFSNKVSYGEYLAPLVAMTPPEYSAIWRTNIPTGMGRCMN